ncbi:MAG: flagellar protein export ATPase FliI [Candidatus Wallbacteria bacterium GWC2_49_35]|uniref:Flagellar protein export ATPase FliI n=1 Tax=Candidatus Wallbacteria bacterium GWC2_49_35 TaxID=1817813 RepID=A0A1F7WYH3_9BACT|nr:MAG: flagellar protein export ATPase FliI [Candidatus Wallbacteria bacterium GWC2_49_35]HBC76621.1 flagellar protein export ATPase FliI [Candidatus Wallbacteria bacterium]
MEFNFNKYYQLLDKIDPIKMNGRVTKLVGLFVESLGPNVCLGEVCMIKPRNSNLPAIAAEVVGFKENKVQLMPLAETTGIAPGSEVVATGSPLKIAVDRRLLGRVVDGLGRPLDNHPPINNPEGFYSTLCQPPNPLTRPRITKPLITGVRCIDGLITLGKGQRVGIFAGSGVGKSTLLGMIARNTRADINVIALIGERGREVKEFIERDLGEEGLKRSVVVVATSDQSSLVRLKGAMVATTIAEYFRDLGLDVVLMMDSVTRFARAQREIGLAVGEPPAQRGYPPSVFAILPKLLERAGTSKKGSITGLYTVLVDGDDFDEPISDTVRGILDGHIVLTRKLAALNHYPAISVLDSISRLMTDVVDKHHQKFANIFKSNLAVYSEAQELINIGAYVDGSNPQIDKAKALYPDMCDYMKQTVQERFSFEDAVDDLQEILKDYK